MKKNNITTTGKMRAALAHAMELVATGNLPAADGHNLIGLSNQITSSLAIELKFQNMQANLGAERTALGALEIG